MRTFRKLDLSQVSIPNAVEEVDFELIVREMRDFVVERFPALVGVIDVPSEPTRALIEAYAYREMLVRQRVNDGAKAGMLAYATGSGLDNLAAFYGIERMPGEADNGFRVRIGLAPEALATGGPAGAYRFFALSVDPSLKDVSVLSPAPGQVLVTLLAGNGDGSVSGEIVARVLTALDAEEVRPLTDVVSVRSAQVVRYSIDARLYLYPGPDAEPIRQNALAAASAYAKARHMLGQDITLSGLHAALHQQGVQRVTVTTPAELPLVVSPQQVAFCEAIKVTVDGRDE